MPVSVPLDFLPPQEPNIVSLTIYESPTKDGDFVSIEVVTEIGEYPNYITRYTTTLADSFTDWFAIQWTDDKGAQSPLSQPIQGGTITLVAQIVERVLLRDPSMDERIVTQEAEGVVKKFFQVTDPYTVTPDQVVGDKMLGLTLFTVARAQIWTLVAGGSSQSYTAGLVSQKSDSGGSGSRESIEWLLTQANKMLGLAVTFVMLLDEIDVTGLNTTSSINDDISRLTATINYE